MDYSSFELSRKTPKDSFLQKFLVKDFEVKEILNTENSSSYTSIRLRALARDKENAS